MSQTKTTLSHSSPPLTFAASTKRLVRKMPNARKDMVVTAASRGGIRSDMPCMKPDTRCIQGGRSGGGRGR